MLRSALTIALIAGLTASAHAGPGARGEFRKAYIAYGKCLEIASMPLLKSRMTDREIANRVIATTCTSEGGEFFLAASDLYDLPIVQKDQRIDRQASSIKNFVTGKIRNHRRGVQTSAR